MPQTRADRTAQILPSPPTKAERDTYFKRNVRLMAAVGLVGLVLVLWMNVHLAKRGASFLPFAVIVPVYLLLVTGSLLMIGSRDEHKLKHRARVLDWRPGRYPSVDVWLPVCGEPLELLENAWSHTSAMRWAGTLCFHVADDAGDPAVRELAERFGFSYSVRANRGHMKKAGNLRHLYETTCGEFAVVFDADFCPREDFLDELMPYFDEPTIGIVQSPQYFRVLSGQHWLERGAGAVQEFFYRSVQTARQHWFSSAICVGTNAVYRRAALEANGGTTLIEHSEDVHTGFDLRCLGWSLRYVPVVLATGVCPSEKGAFMRQQYRWCAGSLSLTFSRKFWSAPLPFASRCCYLTGLGYYASTALQVIITPGMPVMLLLIDPRLVELRNYVFLAPALLFSFVLFPFWNRCHWGIEAWTARLLYGWAHLFAIADVMRGRPMGWTPTGTRTNRRRGFDLAIAWSMAMATLWVALAAYRLHERPLDFVPLLALGIFFFAYVARVYTPASWSVPKPPAGALRKVGATATCILAAGLASPLASSARGAVLGIAGSPQQYEQLRGEGVPVQVLAGWLSFSTRSPEPFLQSVPAGAQAMINWEPSQVPIEDIAAGRYDAYLERWAHAVAAHRAPVLIRFAQEMNGHWFSWSRYGPVAYVRAWRHIVRIFRREGASNARFIWAPDGIIGEPSARWRHELVPWYPGRAYVSYIGMSMVAFASNIRYGERYFFNRLDYLRARFGDAVVLPEMKVTQEQRYAWLRTLRYALAHRPWIGMLVWSETPSDAQRADPEATGQMDWSLLGDPLAGELLTAAVSA
jgi:cellulose synthase (UDP-forming)